MSCPNPIGLLMAEHGNYEYNALFCDDPAVGNESTKIKECIVEMMDHFLKPFTRQSADIETKFFTLKQRWEENTAMLSSITEIAMHPDYQQIIGMGPIAIPLIIRELKNKPNHWFWALKSISGEDPVTPEKRGRIKEMTEAWINWWEESQYKQ